VVDISFNDEYFNPCEKLNLKENLIDQENEKIASAINFQQKTYSERITP
jgi:hypothetical protein